MHAFILRNFKALISPAYAAVLIVYLAFAWFLADPAFDPTAVFSSEKLTDIYDLILMSFMMVNFLLFIIHDFKREWAPSKRDILASRLTARRMLRGLIVGYLLFFLVCFVIPTYGVAVVQQLMYAQDNVRWLTFILKASSGIVGYTFFWILITIWCIARIRNEFVASHGTLFSAYWLANAAKDDNPLSHWNEALIWVSVTAAAFFLAWRLELTIGQKEIREPYREGLLSRVARRIGADLAMHHYRMMGLASQKLLMFCTMGGLAFLIPLFRRTDVNLLPLAKVYLGAFVPLLFSFNQYFMVKIDRDAGMTHNNFLRTMPYPRIVLHRWFVLLLPQLFVQLLFVFIAGVLSQPFPLSFVVYILLLNVLWSAANLFFATATMTNSVANVFLLFLVYVQLRDDVQHLFQSSALLNRFNILGELVQPGFVSVAVIHWLIVGALIASSLLLAFHRLSTVQFADVQG